VVARAKALVKSFKVYKVKSYLWIMSKTMKEKVWGRDLDDNKIELKVDELSFRPSVYGVLIEEEKIFLSKQFDGYDFPGGGMEIDETLDETLEREFEEETGIKVKKMGLITCEHSFFYSKLRKKPFNMILIYYLVEQVGGEVSIAGFDEHEKQYADYPEWIDIKDIDKIKFYNPVDSVAIIKKAIEMLKK
jgi:8-oxo-dGTP diphosphatase